VPERKHQRAIGDFKTVLRKLKDTNTDAAKGQACREMTNVTTDAVAAPPAPPASLADSDRASGCCRSSRRTNHLMP
jgi:hypothetical protein